MFPSGIDSIVARTIALSTGVRVRVAEAGPPRGPPVVLLHGWGASMYSFRHAFALLPPHGLRTIAVDLRGFGLSDKPRAHGAYRIDAFTADLAALIATLEIERPLLAGHSMGGAIALRYAFDHPERVARLALISSAGLAVPSMLPLMRFMPTWLADRLGASLVPRWLVRFILRHVAYGHSERVTAHDIDQYWLPTQLPGFVLAAQAALVEFDWRVVSDTAAASLAVPTVVILGRDDRLIRNARVRAERLRGATVQEFEAGHCVHEEDPTRVYGVLASFFQQWQ